jgi:hypothetical protein
VQLAEEPFLTRNSIMAVLRPSDLPSAEGPWRTLRDHHAVSAGWPVRVRESSGHLQGQLRLFNSLNVDAARASRLRQPEAAQRLAAVAERLERSSAAKRIREAIAALSADVPSDPNSKNAPPGLRRYARLRGRSSGVGFEHGALTREWLAQSRAWLELAGSESGDLADAVVTLGDESDKARVKILAEEMSVATFYGVVRRLDASAAQLESANGEALLVPRGELERQGLAIVGQAVSLLSEELPGGGTYILPMPAVMLEPPSFEGVEAPRELLEPENIAFKPSELDRRDSDWVERALARDPQAVPFAPLPVA